MLPEQRPRDKSGVVCDPSVDDDLSVSTSSTPIPPELERSRVLYVKGFYLKGKKDIN